MVSENRHKTSIHLVPSVCLNFRQAIYKDKKNQTSTSIATVSPPSFVLLDFKLKETNKQKLKTKLTKQTNNEFRIVTLNQIAITVHFHSTKIVVLKP